MSEYHQRKSNLHVVANVLCLLVMETLAGAILWLLISPVWLWLLIFAPVFLFVAYVAHRVSPLVTGPIVEYVFPDRAQVNGKGTPGAQRLRRPVDQREMITAVLGLFLFGYPTVDSFFTDSMLGYWRDGFFRVFRADEPISFWIFRALCIGGTLISVWAIIYLLTTDRLRTEEGS